MQASNTNARIALADLSEAQVVETARAAGEPAWLIERRAAAWRHFAASEPPFWRRTDLSKFKPEEIEPTTDAGHTTLQWDAAAAPKGVVFTTLAQAVHDNPELVERHFGSVIEPLTHKFSALNAALWQDGFFLYVPKNVAIEAPLTALLTLAENNQAVIAHSLVILEQGASVTLVEEYRSPDVASQAFSSPMTEIVLGDGSMLRYVTVQTWGDGVYHIGAQRALVGRDATIEWGALSLGGRVQHLEAETALSGNGSRVDWIAATFADKEQILLTAPWLRHIGTKTEALMNFKTVVKDSSYAIFDGMIKIEHDSHATSSRLEEHALHLTPKARTDSIPGLMIDTNDVSKAGHASTSGEVDEEMLFYMLTRGIKREDAMKLIVMGFFEPVLDRIPTDALRERVVALIESRLI